MMISLVFLTAAVLVPPAWSDEHDHSYRDNEEVILWMNTVGPYHNRQETYSYFALPFCQGPKQSISHYHETLGEALQGVELEYSGLDIDFKGEFMNQIYYVCLPISHWCEMYFSDFSPTMHSHSS